MNIAAINLQPRRHKNFNLIPNEYKNQRGQVAKAYESQPRYIHRCFL